MPHIETVLKFDSHEKGFTYVGWLDSGYRYAVYDELDGVTPVKPSMLTSALDKSSTVEKPDILETPFSEWQFPDMVLEVEIHGHCNLYAMPVTKETILTAWGDRSLEHGVDTPEELRSSVKTQAISQVIPEDTPFKRNKSSDRTGF
jgi:hypothetical protein